MMADAMPIRAKVFIALTAASGVAVLCTTCVHLHSNNLLKFGCYVLIAVLASTMKVQLPGMKSTIDAIEAAGIRSDVKVMIGGAPVTQKFADEIGADGYSPDAASAVDKAKELLHVVA